MANVFNSDIVVLYIYIYIYMCVCVCVCELCVCVRTVHPFTPLLPSNLCVHFVFISFINQPKWRSPIFLNTEVEISESFSAACSYLMKTLVDK